MPETEIFQLFVYGSLRRGFRSPAYEYISRFFNFIGEAKVRGRLLDMGSYPAAIPTNDSSFISGELYQIKKTEDFSWAIGQLDDYEGVSVEPDEIQLYRREMSEVYYEGKVTHAWIYWYNGDVSGRPLISSGDMMGYFNNKV